MNLNHLKSELSVEKVLNRGTGNSNHGKATVHNFGFHSLVQIGRRKLGDEVRGVPSQITRSSFSVRLVEGGNFDTGHEHEDLKVDAPPNSGRSTEWIGVRVGITGKVDASALNDHADDCQHGNATVLELGPACVLQVDCNVSHVMT